MTSITSINRLWSSQTTIMNPIAPSGLQVVAQFGQVRSPTTCVELTPDQALRQLVEGNGRFVNHTTQNPHQDPARLTELTEKQKPFATILGCSDSRVPLEIIFDQGLGDVFVIRVAGNIVTPVEMASIEYGTSVLGTKVLMVLGHANCGAVNATLKGSNLLGQMSSLVEAIQPAIARSQHQLGNALENAAKANVFLQMERLLASSLVVRLIHEGQLKLVGGYYNLESGQVSILSVYPNQSTSTNSDQTSEKESEKLSISEIRYIDFLK
jgi:carbonic anhydrase